MATTLSVVVQYTPGSQKCPVVTHAKVKLGVFTVAEAKLGGMFSQSQVLHELRVAPKRFTPQEIGWSIASRLKLV
jgi:hypothetical protein